MRRDKGRAFLGGSVDVGGDQLAMPVNLFRRVRLIVKVYGDTLTFPEADQRSGKLSVVICDGDDTFRSQLDGCRRDL
jgi:hypothetical protein